ncbi:hypothetical protein BBJ28_00019265 [Nothophytophthora sp. Chile5]|nr:hypothetical protein BBJ28_00019265 [Nothophytophthora sp. Chile5]
MDSSEGRELLQDLNIRVEPVGTVPFAAGEATPAEVFEWESVDEHGRAISLTEEQQRGRYREYVERNIGAVLAEKRLCVVGVKEDENILTVRVPGLDIEFAGRTDLLVLSDLVKKYPLELMFLPEVEMLIEVKRAVEPVSDFQALSELIALDLLSKDLVMALLTDLAGNWHFFWVSEMRGTHACIHKVILTKPGEAFQVIRTLLAQSPSADEIRLPGFQDPVKRRKLETMLPIREGGGGGGILESIQRYYDIAGELGPDIEMAREVARQIVTSMPAFSTY